MKLAWLIVVVLGASSAAETQAEIAARVNQEGVDLMFKGKFDEAVGRFRDAVARVPEPRYFFNLCTGLYQTGKFGEALMACNAVGKSKPDQALQAKTEKMIQRIKDEAARQKIDLDPGPDEAALGAKLDAEGKDLLPTDPKTAAARFMAAVGHDPQPKYYFNLATAELASANYAMALEASKQVSAHHPTADLQTKTEKLAAKIRDEAKAKHVKLD